MTCVYKLLRLAQNQIKENLKTKLRTNRSSSLILLSIYIRLNKLDKKIFNNANNNSNNNTCYLVSIPTTTQFEKLQGDKTEKYKLAPCKHTVKIMITSYILDTLIHPSQIQNEQSNKKQN